MSVYGQLMLYLNIYRPYITFHFIQIITLTLRSKIMDMRRVVILMIYILLTSVLQAQYINEYIGDTIDAVSYRIHLDNIDVNSHIIEGFTEIDITPKVNQISYIPLELQQLTVDSVLVNEEQTTFSHENMRLEINLITPLDIIDTATVTVYYNGQPFHEDWGGFHYSGDYAFNLGVGFVSIPHNLGKTWFPCVDNFTDRATYNLFVNAETGLTVTGGGILVDTIPQSNNHTLWHWQIPHEIPTYLASVTLGDYVEYTDEHVGIERTIPISIFVRPNDLDDVAGSFANLHEVISFLESHFGPYPFEKVGYTGTAIGAMEHASNIAYPSFAIDGGLTYEYLYTHELSHMWFGNKVTCARAEEMWLNESWATFIQVYYLLGLYGYDDFITEMTSMHKDVLQNAHIEDGGYWALNNIPQSVTYGMTAYDKGATVVNTLRNYLGDSLFIETMTAFLSCDTIAYRSVSTEIMRDFITEYTGIDMTPFFDAWVMTPGTPHFSIDSTIITENQDSYTINVYLKQKYKGVDNLADANILEITFIDEDFRFITDTVHFSGKTGHSVLSFSKDVMPKSPVVSAMDIYYKTMDATTDNYHYFDSPDEYSFPDTYFKVFIDELSDSCFIRTTHNWVAPDSLKTPIEGLTLSPYRYWKIENVARGDIQARGSFFYSTMSHLDDGLITSPNDSAVILYREDAAHEWQEPEQSRLGIWSTGNILVEDLQPGEYTMAVWDKTIVSTNNVNNNKEQVKIYPNPTTGVVNFEFNASNIYNVYVYDNAGRLLDKQTIKDNKGSYNLSGLNVNTGTFIIMISCNGTTVASSKIIMKSR